MRELRSIAKELKNADLDVVQQVVVREVQKEQHVHFFQDRKALWCYLIGDSCVAFRELLKDGIDKFCFLYVDQCSKGADRHLRLLLAWNNYSATYAVASMSTPASSRRWSRLLSGYAGAVSDDCRSAVMSVVFSALFTYIVRQRDLILDNLSSRCESAIRKEPAAPVTPDDDVSLYRLFGFSLHVSIQFRSRSCWNRSRVAKRYTLEKKQKFRKQLSMLKVLVESDKTVIPAILKKQDRGRMKFPHRLLLPFCRACSVKIKSTLNMQALLKDGRKISKVILCTYTSMSVAIQDGFFCTFPLQSLYVSYTTCAQSSGQHP